MKFAVLMILVFTGIAIAQSASTASRSKVTEAGKPDDTAPVMVGRAISPVVAISPERGPQPV